MEAASGDIGFVSYNCGTIENLKLSAVTVNDQVDLAANIGLLVGYNQKGTVRNCAVINGENGGSITLAGVSDFYVGNLMGYNNEGLIINCSATGNITVTSALKLAHAGGLVGENNGEVKNSYADGDVSITTAHNYAYIGGLTACNLGKLSFSYADGSIMLSMNTGSATAYTYGGGLVGLNIGEVGSCYATGNLYVKADTTQTADTGVRAHVGGLVGMNREGMILTSYAANMIVAETAGAYDQAIAGGLVGTNRDGILTSCFATGNVGAIAEGSYAYAGAIIGTGKSDEVQNCYYATEMQFVAHDSSRGPIEDIEPVETPTNATGTEKDLENFEGNVFVPGALMWSTTAWTFGTAEEPALPTLTVVGPTFTEAVE